MPIRPTPIPEQLSRAVLDHLNQLGISNVKTYRRWCVENGFGRGLNKNKANRRAELTAARRNQDSAADDFLRLCKRQPIKALQAICEGKVDPAHLPSPELLEFSKALTAAARSKHEPALNRSALSDVLKRLSQRRAKFIGLALAQRASSSSNYETLLALARVVQYRSWWVRPLDQWRPKSKSSRRQFESLLQHLFAKYEPMPAFFQQVWTSSATAMTRYRRWYLRVGRGENLRKCDLPIPYTRRMAHWFMRAPDNFSVPQALRFGQVIGLGGDQRLARTIAMTRLADNFSCDEFWVTVIRWFVNQPLLDPVQVGPIIDYIYFQRFVPEHVMVGLNRQIDDADRAAAGARQPNFTMRDRTAESLVRHVNRWHQGLANSNRQQVCTWIPSGITAFSLLEGGQSSEDHTASVNLEGNVKHWTIRELLSSASLVAEGRKLNHCVASYASSCRNRSTSIWTMEVESFSGLKKLLTIEVSLRARAVVQIRGKNNRFPNEKELGLIRRWAAEAGLKLRVC